MQPQQFAKWRQKKILGASLKIVAPTGQYDPTKLINWSINRWALGFNLIRGTLAAGSAEKLPRGVRVTDRVVRRNPGAYDKADERTEAGHIH
jgi:hypothetical protein